MAKLRHIAISVPDLEAAAAFYENAFGLERVRQTKMRINLSDGTVNLTLLPHDDLAGDPRKQFVGLHHIGVTVDDVAETVEKIEANGGRRVALPADRVASNSDSKCWDPNGVMVDISATDWVGTK